MTLLQLLYRGEFLEHDPELPLTLWSDGYRLWNIVGRALGQLGCDARDLEKLHMVAEFSDRVISDAIVEGRLTTLDERQAEVCVTPSIARNLDLDPIYLVLFVCDSLSHGAVSAPDGITPKSVLAVHAILECLKASQLHERGATSIKDRMNHAVLATEYLVMSEQGIPTDDASSGIKMVLRERGQRASKSRWDKWQPVIDKAREIYISRKNEWSSRRRAAQVIAQEIAPLLKELGLRLSEDHGTTTVYGWLKEFDEELAQRDQ